MQRILGRLAHYGLLAILSLSLETAVAAVSFDSGRQRVTLIELFTSQGCSSCPPADAWLARFKDAEDLWKKVVPLAFHVDYWDSLGWKDPFASAEYSQRQYEYKRKGGLSSVYTPGILVDGKEWRGWVRGREPKFQRDNVGRLTLSLEGRRVSAIYQGTGATAASNRLNLAVLAFGLSTRVERGENRGRQLAEEFVVVGFKSALSDGNTWEMQLPELVEHKAKRHALVAWVSDARTPTPLQATGGWLPRTAEADLLSMSSAEAFEYTVR